jgi:uncharacterized protein (TIGR02001 family)
MARGSFVGTMKSGLLAAAILGGMALPAYAESDIAIAGNVNLTTDYVFRGITQTASNPAIQGEFDVTYKWLYFTLWSSNLDFGGGPNGQDLASIEIDYDAGIRPVWGKTTFDFGAYYYTYPGAFDPGGEFDYVELKSGVSRPFFNDKLALSLANYWSPDNFAETGKNDVLEFGAGWTFDKVWYFTPVLSGVLGHQWGEKSQGGFDYTYWNVGLTLGFNNKPPLSLDIRYWDTGDFQNFACPSSGVGSCDSRVVGSFKASF